MDCDYWVGVVFWKKNYQVLFLQILFSLEDPTEINSLTEKR